MVIWTRVGPLRTCPPHFKLLSFYTLYTLRGDGVDLARAAAASDQFQPRWPQNVMTWDTSSGGSK